MRPLSALFAALLLAAGCASEEPVGESTPAGRPLPSVERHEPGPGDPPVIWVAGTVERIGKGEIAVRQGAGPRVALVRLAEGATRFFGLEGDAWLELSSDDVALVEVGTAACVEAVADAGTFLALRVFLGASCGPS